MESQLVLIETPAEWHLDERTCELGRQGLAQARAALRDALSRTATEPDGQRSAA